jgi:transposase
VKSCQAVSGVSLLTAFGIAAEVGDMQRFNGAKHFMAFLGLVPSENSSGATVRCGGITKTGNSLVRRLLIEAAWSYRLKARKNHALLKRQQDLPDAVLTLSWKAQLRLCDRYQRLSSKGKCIQKVITSVAREFAGFLWAAGRCIDPILN